MRGEKTESDFTTKMWKQVEPKGLQEVPRDKFYQHMADMGLRYGDEFKGLREVSALDGKAAGKISVSENIEDRISEYKVHPVLFDAALHVFSASLKSISYPSKDALISPKFPTKKII